MYIKGHLIPGDEGTETTNPPGMSCSVCLGKQSRVPTMHYGKGVHTGPYRGFHCEFLMFQFPDVLIGFCVSLCLCPLSNMCTLRTHFCVPLDSYLEINKCIGRICIYTSGNIRPYVNISHEVNGVEESGGGVRVAARSASLKK